MRFTLASLGPNGEVGSIRHFSTEQIRSAGRTRRFVAKLEQLFREQLQPTPQGGRELSASLDGAHKISLQWLQPWPFCASGFLDVVGRPCCATAFLPGYYRIMEEVPLRVIEELLTAATGKPVRSALRTFDERPLVALAGSSYPIPKNVNPHEVLDWVVCLAVIYFEFAAERHAALPLDLKDPEAPPPEAQGNGNGQQH